LLAEKGWHECEFKRNNNGILARVAKDLPIGLVHWREFAPASFDADLMAAYAKQVPWSAAE
jgi:hypothetical protein